MTRGPSTTASLLYKILPRYLWDRAGAESRLPWSPTDVLDGFVHLSSANQVEDTAHRHFGNEVDLVLVALDPSQFAEGTLRWEPSHGGEDFPHVYGDIPLDAVVEIHALVGDEPGRFDFPDLR
jgi:uncharacterized protein (DUF952 family)